MGLKEAGLRGSLRSVSTGVSAIPDSAIAQYDATTLGLSDDDAVTSWPDDSGAGNDLSGGTPIYKEAVQNGNPVVRYDGSGDTLNRDAFSVSQPITIIAVVVSAAQTNSQEIIASRTDSNEDFWALRWGGPNYEWNLYFGNELDGGTEPPPVIISGIADGTNSIIRINGSQTGSGDVGGRTVASLDVGSVDAGSTVLDGDLGEVLIYDTDLSDSDDLDAEEQRLSDKWGISLA